MSFRLLPLVLSLALGACAPLPDVRERWHEVLEAFAEADAAAPPQPGGVLFVGSSSVRRWEGLPEALPGLALVNRGVDGVELAEVSLHARDLVGPYAPRLIVVYAGDNDLAQGRSPEAVLAAYRAFVAEVHALQPDTPIVFVAIKPSLARLPLLGAIQTANELIAAYSGEQEALTFLDVFSPMLGADGLPRRELFVADGLHLSAAGYALWLELLRGLLE